MEHFVNAIKLHYADFTGRATRTQYWMYTLFYILIYIGLGVIDYIIGMNLLTALFALALLIPSIAIAARRLHDTNRSGWWQLIAIIPLIGAIVLIVFLVSDTQPEDNQYGPNPKAGAL
ncbi:MAG: DUF805 domain-containing protein [Gammaproteobacteria bacterium HGW-Gammaproteobacteria-11]|nr:MAG: DUF805 domain-containing protein [Gammaproteobacteria bacterium HGW-Gammaproteobacteria-11]